MVKNQDWPKKDGIINFFFVLTNFDFVSGHLGRYKVKHGNTVEHEKRGKIERKEKELDKERKGKMKIKKLKANKYRI